MISIVYREDREGAADFIWRPECNTSCSTGDVKLRQDRFIALIQDDEANLCSLPHQRDSELPTIQCYGSSPRKAPAG